MKQLLYAPVALLCVAASLLGQQGQVGGGITQPGNVQFSATDPTGNSCIVGQSANITYTIPNPPIDFVCGNGAIGSAGVYVAKGNGTVTTLAASGVGASGAAGANKLTGPANTFAHLDSSGNGEGLTPAQTSDLIPLATSVQGTGSSNQIRDFISALDPRIGAKGDCSTDDTAAFQTYFTSYAPSGYKLWVPNPPGGAGCSSNPPFYKLTASLNIPLASGWQVDGQSSANTQIQMATSNTPMFVFKKEASSLYAFRNLYLSYATQQTPGSNPLSAFFYLNPDTQTGVGNFLADFDHILLGNGYRGWAIASASTTGSPWWRSHWHFIEAAGTMTGETLYLVPSPTIGVEGDTFENIINYQTVAGQQFNISGLSNGILRNVSFLNGSNTVALLSANANITLEQIHIEAHADNGAFTNEPVIIAANSNMIIDGISYSGAVTANTIGFLVRSPSGGGSVQIRQAVVNLSSLGSGATFALIGGAAGGATYWTLDDYTLSGGAINYSQTDPAFTNGFIFTDNNKIVNAASLGVTGTGAASFSPLTLTGTVFIGGNGTTTVPFLYLNFGATTTSWSTTGTLLGMNAPSGFTGALFDFHVNGGASVALLTSGGSLILGGNLTVPSTNNITFSARSKSTSPADGVWNFTNNAGSSFTRLDLGGTTSSSAAFCVSGLAVSVCGADGTATVGSFAAPHIKGTSGTPSVAAGGAIGTTPTIAGNDFMGTVTVPSTAVTSGTVATVTFATSYAVAPQCLVMQNGGLVAIGVGHGTPGTGSFTITASIANVSAAAYLFDYVCSGN